MGLWDALKQYIRDASPGGSLNPEVTPQGALDAAAMSTMAVPVVGDIAGVASDAYRMYQNPEERTAGNVALAIMGGLPLMPNAGALLARARQMENIGASPGRILQETGLQKIPTAPGQPSQYGQEISDVGATIRPDVLAKVKTPIDKTIDYRKQIPVENVTLGDLLDHPELFRRYPDLAKINIEQVSGFQAIGGVQGYYDAASNVLGVTRLNPYMTSPEQIQRQLKELTSTLLHEAQHGVQSIEGWARGGNTGEFTKQSTKTAEKVVNKAKQNLDKAVEADFIARGLKKPSMSTGYVLERALKTQQQGEESLKFASADLVQDVKNILASPQFENFVKAYGRIDNVASKVQTRNAKSFADYQRLAGEAQSRAVQKAFETGNKRPVSMEYDVPLENLLFKDPFAPTIK
jgi:hypothetical protein